MDAVIKAGLWEKTIGGVKFVSRRKSTAVMVQARGFLAVAGQLAAASEPAESDGLDQLKKLAEFTEACMRASVVEPAISPDGEPTVPGVQYAYSDLLFAADVWIDGFMKSGVSADPIVPSCEE